MDIVQSTQKYEAWLARRIPILRADLRFKHEQMRLAVFPFLRATFYRWSQTWPAVSPKTFKAPLVLGVGDLHVENFGTWRDTEGRLIWGINDFDEATRLPYTCDLVRLATSAHLAIAAEHLTVPPHTACDAITEGYIEGLEAGGGAFVLAEHHTSLREMAVERLKQPELFWKKLHSNRTWKGKIPESAMKALKRAMPGKIDRIAHRLAGLGSLGRRRFVALAEWHDGSVAREVKELTDSAWRWDEGLESGIRYQQILNCARRCPDPFVELRGKWIVRRLAPDCSRVELASLPTRHDATRLLHSMGFETANVHLGTLDAKVLLRDVRKREAKWLHNAALAMAESVRADWKAYKASLKS